jgi:hypothetical protein
MRGRNESFYIDEAEERGWLPLSPAPLSPLGSSVASLWTIVLDDSEHLLHNHHASVASLRLLFTFTPECRSESLRNSVHLHRNTQFEKLLQNIRVVGFDTGG